MADPAVLARLRALTTGPPPVTVGRLPAVLPALEAWFGGWSRPGLTEIVGRPGSGRLALILPAVRAILARGRPVVVVDPWRQVYPPGWGEAGAVPSSLVLVRPPPDLAGWTAEQVARSGAVEALVVLDAGPLGRAGLRTARACEAGEMAVFVVGTGEEAELPATLRLTAMGWEAPGLVRVACTRSRNGRQVGERVVAMRRPEGGGRVMPFPGEAASPAPLEAPAAPPAPPMPERATRRAMKHNRWHRPYLQLFARGNE
jgi:hypothetical protein